jgi:hypothetical protein
MSGLDDLTEVSQALMQEVAVAKRTVRVKGGKDKSYAVKLASALTTNGWETIWAKEVPSLCIAIRVSHEPTRRLLMDRGGVQE